MAKKATAEEKLKRQQQFAEFVGRLKDEFDTRNDSQAAKLVGYSSCGFANAKRNGNIAPAWLLKLPLEYRLNPEWLMTGQGKRYMVESDARVPVEPPKPVKEVPIHKIATEDLMVELDRRYAEFGFKVDFSIQRDLREEERGKEAMRVDKCNRKGYSLRMIKTWKHKGLQKLHNTGKVAKGVSAKHAKKIATILDGLESAQVVQDMGLPGLRLHPLHGPLEGHWSVDVSGNWRVTFRFDAGHVYDVNYQDTH